MVKKYEMDLSKTWEERYAELEIHHITETTELFEKLQAARAKNKELEEQLEKWTEWDLDDDRD